jgi:hypothetical protein
MRQKQATAISRAARLKESPPTLYLLFNEQPQDNRPKGGRVAATLVRRLAEGFSTMDAGCPAWIASAPIVKVPANSGEDLAVQKSLVRFPWIRLEQRSRTKPGLSSGCRRRYIRSRLPPANRFAAAAPLRRQAASLRARRLIVLLNLQPLEKVVGRDWRAVRRGNPAVRRDCAYEPQVTHAGSNQRSASPS